MTPSPATTEAARRPSRPWLRWLGAGVVVYLVACGWWVQYINSVPQVDIPNPRLPWPNAFAFYQRAGLLAAPRMGPDRFEASGLAPSTPPPSNYLYKASWPQKEAWLAHHQEIFKLLRQGFHYSYVQPPSRSAREYFPHLIRFREVARLLVVDSQTKAHRGDWDGAATSALDAVEFGKDIPRGGPMEAAMSGIAVQWMGCKELWRAPTHLNGMQARLAARRLERIVDARTPFAESLLQEKWSMQAGLLEMMRKHEVPLILDGIEEPRDIWLHTRFMNNHAILNNYSHALDVQIANAQRPYNVAQQPAPPMRWSWSDPITVHIGYEFPKGRIHSLRNEANNSLVLVALALRAYCLDHTAYPQGLHQLVPTYLCGVPADPFGGGEPLRYRMRPVRHVTAVQYVPAPGSSPASNTGYPGGGPMNIKYSYAWQPYTLYSIGPDGVDNAGVPIDDGTNDERSPRKRYTVKPDSHGDMVAGVYQ